MLPSLLQYQLFVAKSSASFVVGVNAAYVKAAAIHVPSVHFNMLSHIDSEVARSICATAIGY